MTPRQSFALGYVFGLAMLGVTISWVYVLGVWIVLILIAFESLFFGLLGMALHLISTLRAWPLAAACCWVMIELRTPVSTGSAAGMDAVGLRCGRYSTGRLRQSLALRACPFSSPDRS